MIKKYGVKFNAFTRMDGLLKDYNQEYIEYIIDELSFKLPSCHPDYGWEYDDLEEVIKDGLSITISLPSYKQWLRDKKIEELLK